MSKKLMSFIVALTLAIGVSGMSRVIRAEEGAKPAAATATDTTTPKKMKKHHHSKKHATKPAEEAAPAK